MLIAHYIMIQPFICYLQRCGYLPDDDASKAQDNTKTFSLSENPGQLAAADIKDGVID